MMRYRYIQFSKELNVICILGILYSKTNTTLIIILSFTHNLLIRTFYRLCSKIRDLSVNF